MDSSSRSPRMNKALSEPADPANDRENRNARPPATRPRRSVSLQHSSEYFKLENQMNQSSPGASGNRTVSLAPSFSSEVISLATLPKGLGLTERQSSSISFSAVGFIVESMQELHRSISDKMPDVERTVNAGDIERLRKISAGDRMTLAAAAFFAVRENKYEVLPKVLDLCQEFYDLRELNEGRGCDGLLHVAAAAGSKEATTILLGRGLDPNQWNEFGNATPMHLAAKAGNLKLLKTLIDEGGGRINEGANEEDGRSVVQAAIKADQREVVRFLLDRNIQKASITPFSETALHTACEHNNSACAEMLLACEGVYVDARRSADTKETALHIAAANGYLESTLLLLKNAADPNARNAKTETPLHLAARMLSAPVMRALLDAGADVNVPDREGRPPLHFAINSKLRGAGECMQLLLKYGADIDRGDSNGTTALHLAAFSRRFSRVKRLIDNGADLCLKNKTGKSALHFVMKYVPDAIRTLEERMDNGLKMESSKQESRLDRDVATMDFNLLIPSKANAFVSEVGLFTEILQMHGNDTQRLEKIFMHPLSLSFLHLKWQQIKWLYYILILLSHFIYSLTYSVYVIVVLNTMCKPSESQVQAADIAERFTMHVDCKFGDPEYSVPENVSFISWIMLIIFNLIYLLKETTKLLHLRDRYFKEWESCLNLITICTFPMISFHDNPFTGDVNFYGWQFHAAGIGVLITWVLQMFLIGKVPRFGKYVQMLMTVGWSFFNFFVAYFALILGFTLSFVILFPREVAFQHSLTAAIKVLVMMTGEIEYNDLYYTSHQTIDFNLTQDANGTHSHGVGTISEVDEPRFYPVTAHVVLTVFIIVVAIVIMNLLFGMAVSDVQELYKQSKLNQSIQQVHLISYMESMLGSPLFMKLPNLVQSFLLRKLHGLEGRYRNICEIELDSYDKKRILPTHLNRLIKDKCHEILRRREGQPSMKSLEQQINHMQRQMNLMQESIRHLANNRLSMATTASVGDSNSEDNNNIASSVSSSSRLQKSMLSLDDEDATFEDSRDSGGKKISVTSIGTLSRINEIDDDDDFMVDDEEFGNTNC